MRKALMVVYYFPPLGGGGTQRALKFARYLPDYGWQPQVLSVRNSHYLVHDESLQHELRREVRITRTPAILPGRFMRKMTNYQVNGETGNGNANGSIISPAAPKPPLRALQFLKKAFYTTFYVPDEYIGWMPFAVATGKRLCKQDGIDLIFSSGPPNTTHMIARRLKKATGLPWVADLRDLWDQYPDSYNPFRLKARKRLEEYLERKTLLDADGFLVVSEQMRHDLREKFPQIDAERICVITNGFDTTDFANLKPESDPDYFTVVHAGSLFPWRSLRPFLQAVKEFFRRSASAQQRFRLKLLGIIPEQERSAIADAGLQENVIIHDYLPYRQALSHIVSADVALLLLGECGHPANMLTSKLFDYMGARRPILAIGPHGDLHRLLRQENLGAAFSDEQTSQIAEALHRYFESWQQGKPMVINSRYRRFDRRILTEKLSNVFNAVVE
jgi:glycosyltransferase involved in cell wall biosynthesis